MQTNDNDISGLYQQREWANSYDHIRFANAGGRLINERELGFVSRSMASLPTEASVLDVASGTGRFALSLAQRGFRVTAFDSSNPMLEQIRHKADEHAVNVELVEGDVRNMPFDRAQFDGVCCFRLLWHYDDWPSLLHAMADCAKGPVAFDLMNRRSLRRLIRPVALRKAYESHTTDQDVVSWCAKCGYTVLRAEQAFAFPFIVYLKLPFLARWLWPLDQWLSRRGWGTMLHYTIQKEG